jgi:type IV pilus assembly protein PilA
MLQQLRRRAEDEKGFTLIELLVVILIIGILAAIAIPAFLNQRTKAYDAATKSNLRTAQTAEETYATDNGGAYTAADTSAGAADPLVKIEPLNNKPSVTATLGASGGYVLTSTSVGPSGSAVTYTITVAKDGTVTRTCAPASTGGCHTADAAGNMW